MKELLIVGVGVMGRPYLDAAARLGLKVSAVESAAAYDNRPTDLGVTYHRVDGEAEESWNQGVAEALAASVPDGVLAFAEPHVLAGALAQDRLGLPGPSLHAAVISRNKALQRTGFSAHGVPQPEFFLASDVGRAREWMLDRLPVVVKPLSESGSSGVELVLDAAAVPELIARRSAEGTVLVEQAVLGPEFSWEALVRDGEVLFENFTAKETTPPPYFVELCHRIGHRFEDGETADQVNALTRGVLGAIGMRTGLVHLEFRLGPDGPALMEIAVRTPGDYLGEAVGLTYGFDLYEAVIRLALGLPLDGLLNADPVRYAATWFPTVEPGRISRIEGVEEALAHPAVVRVRLRKQVGDVVGPLTSSSARLGHVLVDAASPEEREEALEHVRKHLRVSVD
ncbi:ATP-grasp domain-containing protein [Kitasatospora sp. MAP5-34]|uniref:ATP-grasp domain-containing protein n=1 Tax=Kitasatospora sp. MAP5-34 TaxID=3035102 RepID=UPI002476DA85|nr:ATP-grasp domain-containing protein [Kitasatospora sp. MAP5-34]MDH6579059.1 biotin carboxylase [Kitasatospora sp. MAP5-34]